MVNKEQNINMDEEAAMDENMLPVEEQVTDETTSFVKELEEQKEKYIRLLAEFENFKRRTARERMDLFKTAGQDVIKDLLPALDDIDRAENVIQEAKDFEAVKQGLKLINEKIRSILIQKGVKEIECLGKEFNTDMMEAITEIDAPSEDMVGKVVDVLEKGYTLNDKIIRYAKVVTGK
ncbi:MAG: nucleotide exchange factor GrpE [Chitinophagales bacterium]